MQDVRSSNETHHPNRRFVWGQASAHNSTRRQAELAPAPAHPGDWYIPLWKRLQVPVRTIPFPRVSPVMSMAVQFPVAVANPCFSTALMRWIFTLPFQSWRTDSQAASQAASSGRKSCSYWPADCLLLDNSVSTAQCTERIVKVNREDLGQKGNELP